MRLSRYLFILLTSVAATSPATAETQCSDWVAKLESSLGRVERQRAGSLAWRAAQSNDAYCPGGKIRTWERSRAVLELTNETFLTVDQKTTLVFTGLEKKETSWLDVLKGMLYIRSRVPQTLQINTPFVNAVIKGTEFLVSVEHDQAQITVYEGTVAATNALGDMVVHKGQSVTAKSGQAPKLKLLVRPADAVQWTLYYPPLIDYRNYADAAAPPEIKAAISAYRRDELPSAFSHLDRVPPQQRNARFFTLRAGLLLMVGRVDEARQDIEQAQTLAPKDATATALRSVIALAQNRNPDALSLARKAAEQDPRSPVAQIALSYAFQALFDTQTALEHAQKAAELAEDNALAWARVAELQLALGYQSRALEAAQKAAALDPELSRTQYVLGFAHLAQIDVDAAKESFEQAIAFNPADPLPRLGLGLAKIREGDLQEGTQEIELAASLDPDNSLIRSYLGKAYYDQKRGRLAAKEFAIAKTLDPNDPTPWFYDAIYNQTINRPVEALHGMQKAIELNDNRAVYRSRLLLDQDLAARTANIARIYNDLGFDQRALLEGWKSVNTDPSNYSSHRLLADSYSALPRHGIAKVSELLQSQLLQPINITPVQPQLAESNLLIVDGAGPADATFNEFNPLFARNRLVFQPSAVIGSNETYGDEVVQSGLWGKFSYSLGQFHYQTNGIRDNNDLKQDIYSAFVQGMITPEFSVQAEYRYNDTRHGDLRFRNSEFFNTDFRRDARSNMYRLGFHFAPAPHSDFIASFIYQDQKEAQGFGASRKVNNDDRAGIAEVQYLFGHERLHLVAGGGYYNQKQNLLFEFGPFQFPNDRRIEHGNAYLYSTVHFPNPLTWTLGVSYDAFSLTGSDTKKQVNPKLGVIWNITPNTTARAAWFKVLKRSLIADQTIEPTQVAGFNQFFDDFSGTESTRYGIAVDQKFSLNLYGGLEVSKRKLYVPGVDAADNTAITGKWDEELYRAYLYWVPGPDWSISAEYRFENFRRDSLLLNTDDPSKVKTHLAPLSLKYFHPSGFFSDLTVTYVNQAVERAQEDTNESFALLDLSLGYRLPKRYGILEIEGKNLFGQAIRFQGVDFRTSRIVNTPPFTNRAVFARFSLAF